jgi:hypothetical protein
MIEWVASRLGYPSWVDNVHKAPSERQLTGWLKEQMQPAGKERVVYPDILVPKAMRPLYKLCRKSRFVNLMPLGHMYIYQKV